MSPLKFEDKNRSLESVILDSIQGWLINQLCTLWDKVRGNCNYSLG
jgi:hypothetical protein